MNTQDEQDDRRWFQVSTAEGDTCGNEWESDEADRYFSAPSINHVVEHLGWEVSAFKHPDTCEHVAKSIPGERGYGSWKDNPEFPKKWAQSKSRCISVECHVAPFKKGYIEEFQIQTIPKQ